MSALTAEMIKDKVAEASASFGSLGLAEDEIDTTELVTCLLIPESCVAMLIGKAGSNMAVIKAATGAFISFSKKELSVHGNRKAFVTGTVGNATKLVLVVTELMSSIRGPNCSVSVVVADKSVGALVGKGAANLKAVREMTGCHLDMEKPEAAIPAHGGRCLTIRHDESCLSVTLAFYQMIRTKGFASPSQSSTRDLAASTTSYLVPNQAGAEMDPYAYGAVQNSSSNRFSPYGRPTGTGDVCAVHGKKRGKQNLQPSPVAQGQFICRPEDPCKGGVVQPQPGGMGSAAGANICATHGKKRGTKNLQPHPTAAGLFTCLTGDECKGAN